MRLYIATTNPGKLRDFALAASGDVSILPLPGLASIAAPNEDEDTFEGNARLKAIYYSRFAHGEVVVADDSGLEVDALGGAPGVRSARYSEDAGYLTHSGLPIDERNNRLLNSSLEGLPVAERTARYRCALAAAVDGEVVALGLGAVEGSILLEPRGSAGFGYDPFFAPKGLPQSMAELSGEQRLSLSHRGRAFHDLLPRLSARPTC